MPWCLFLLNKVQKWAINCKIWKRTRTVSNCSVLCVLHLLMNDATLNFLRENDVIGYINAITLHCVSQADTLHFIFFIYRKKKKVEHNRRSLAQRAPAHTAHKKKKRGKKYTYTTDWLSITLLLFPTEPTMNLHRQRSRQRQRTDPRLRNDCSESVLVMWFVTPSALLLIWLGDGLRPAVSNETADPDRTGKEREAESARNRLRSVTAARRRGNSSRKSAETMGDSLAHAHESVCIRYTESDP